LAVVCGNCRHEVPLEVRNCPICTADVGYPNVRAANRVEEVNALMARVKGVETSARTHNAQTELALFSDSVASSRAVMNRSLGVLHAWLNGANPLFLTFHQQVRLGSRFAANDVWDQQRTSAENTVNPIYYEQLNFAALSLDRTGLTHYGQYCVSLKDGLIGHRSSVFEENPFIFCQRHNIISGRPAPLGYRASWAERAHLAVAKLGSKINAGTLPSSFPEVLMEPRRNDPDCDFIEAHIFGPIHVAAIEHVVGPKPAEAADRALWNQAKRKLELLGATWDEF
jgi:hypothetical protein